MSDLWTPSSSGTDRINSMSMAEQALFAANGTPIKWSNFAMQDVDGNTTLTDGRMAVFAMWLPAMTVSTIYFIQAVNGNFTADNNNKLGLYTNNGTNLTKVAETASDDNLFKSGAGLKSKALSSTYDTSEGLYYVAFLYNQSAATTTPSFCRAQVGNTAVVDCLGSDYQTAYQFNSQTDLPSSIAISGQTSLNSMILWIGIG